MIRRLTENDRERYISMAREFYHSDAVLHPIPDVHFERTVDEALRSDDYAEIFLFECEGETAGYGLTAKTYSQEAGGFVWWIEEIYIRPEYQGKGIGSRVFKKLDAMFDAGVYRLRLEVEKTNVRAVELYERQGYTWLAYDQMIKDK